MHEPDRHRALAHVNAHELAQAEAWSSNATLST